MPSKKISTTAKQSLSGKTGFWWAYALGLLIAAIGGTMGKINNAFFTANLLMIAVMFVLVYASYKSILKDKATGEYKTLVITTMACLGFFAGSILLFIFNSKLDESFKWFFVSFVITIIIWNAALFGLGFFNTSVSTAPFTMAIGATSNYTVAEQSQFCSNNTAFAYGLFKPSFPSNYTIMDVFCNGGIIYVTLKPIPQ